MKKKRTQSLKGLGRKLLCGALALVMTGSVVMEPVAAAAAERWTPILLEAERLENVPEGNYLYFGTASASVLEEDAAYSVVIYREGDLSGEASVEVRTIDLSATYGKDYSLLMPSVEKSGDGQTILEKYMEAINGMENTDSEPADSEPVDSEPADSESVDSESVDSEPVDSEPVDSEPVDSEPVDSEPVDSEPVDGEPVDGEPADSEPAESKPVVSEPGDYVEVEGNGSSVEPEDTGKSALAILKEAQTGEETRDLYETVYEDITNKLAAQMMPQLMDEIDHSSSTVVTFAPGESEKTLVFRIKDDHKTEGTETFSIRLTNAVGATVYSVDTLSVTIEDDEPAVHSKITFGRNSYVAENGEVTVTIKRTDADYSLVDMRLVSCGDTAVAGVNYEEINETIAFLPYEMEKEITIPVYGEGKFSLMLTDMTACEAGTYTETVIDIIPTDDAASAYQLRTGSSQSFNLTIGGKQYKVAYNEGDYMGTIIDTGYTPEVEVGTYYFPMDTGRGGIFHYDESWNNSAYFEGDKPNGLGTKECEYREYSPQHNSYGCVEYYNTTFWKEGMITTFTDAVVPTSYYQYITPWWEAPEALGNNLRYYFRLPTLGAQVKIDTNTSFDRTADNAIIKLMNGNSAYNKMTSISVSAADETDNCPKSYIHLYGVACMYKRYRVSVTTPNSLSYRTGEGTSTVSTIPVNFHVECGAQTFKVGDTERDIYVNTDDTATNLVFNLENSMVNGEEGKFGTLTGYTITLDPGSSDQRVTLNYPADFETYLKNSKGTTGKCADYSSAAVEARINQIGDLQTTLAVVPYDIYFIEWIDSVQKGVASDSVGYHQNITFKPIFDYTDCTVRVLEPEDGLEGAFTDSTLSKVGTYTFHAGDVLDLSTVSYTNGYDAVGYVISYNEGASWDYVTSNNKLLLKSGTYYIRPMLYEVGNCIEIRFDDTITGGMASLALSEMEISGVSYQGLIDENLLVGTDEAGKMILRLDASENASLHDQRTPNVGEVYTITVKPVTIDSTTYYPVFIDAFGDVYDATNFHYTARQKKENNVLTLSCVGDASELNTYVVKGRLVTQCDPIISTGTESPKLGVDGYTVSMGKNDTDASSATAFTDAYGYFTLYDVKFYGDGDEPSTTTMLVSNGKSSYVVEIPYQTTKSQTDTVMDLGEISLEYPYNAPKVTGITYKYDKESNNANSTTTNNAVNIYDDNFHITATVDKQEQNVVGAYFYIRTSKGNLAETYVTEDAENPGVIEYTIKGMSRELSNGDRVLVSLVVEENGVKFTYPMVDTGIVFFVENVIKVEQYYSTDEVAIANVPMLNTVNSKGSSGLISFARTDWSGGTGYTLTINMDALFANKATPTASEKRGMAEQFFMAAQDVQLYKEQASTVENQLTDLWNSTVGIEARAAKGVASEKEMEDYFNIGDQIELGEELLAESKAKGAEAKGTVAQYGSGNIKQVEVLFLLAFDFVLDAENQEYVFCSGAVSLGGSFTYSKTLYAIFYGAPIFFTFTGFAQADFTIYYPVPDNAISARVIEDYAGNIADRMEDVTASSTIGFGFKVGVGVGMCNVLSAYANANVQLMANISNDSGFMITGGGGITVDLLIMSMSLPIFNGTKGWGSYSSKDNITYLGGFDALLKSENSGGSTASSESTVSLGDYDAGTSDLSGFGGNGFVQATPEAVSRTVLLSDAAERTAPQIIDLGNGQKMIFFIANRGSASDSINSRALFYSVYSGGQWSEPRMVADDGTFDASPVALARNGKVIVAWVDADGSAMGSSDTIAKLNSLGISAAVYDSSSGTWSREFTLVQDQFFNFAPQLNLVGNTIYCSYMKRDISDVTTVTGLLDFTNTYSTMAYMTIDATTGQVILNNGNRETYISIQHPDADLKDPLVTDYQCVTTEMSGENYMLAAYTVDEDMDLSTSGDRELFLAITNLTTGVSYYPIQLTDDSLNQANPLLTDLDGIVYLTWLEEGTEFNLLDVSGMLEGFFYTGEVGNAYRNDSGPSWYRKTAAELGLSEDAYFGTYYDYANRGIFRPQTADLTIPNGVQTSISKYDLVSNGDDVYIFFTNYASLDPSNFSEEIFGLVYQRDMKPGDGVNEPWGFGKVVQITDFGKTIDEFDIIMNEKNEISVVSNHYKQWIDEVTYTAQKSANQLVEIDFEPVGSLSIQKNNIDLPSNLVGGNRDIVSFTVENNGLMPASGFTVTLSQIKGDVESVVDSWVFDETIGSGGSFDVEIPWTVPSDLEDTSLKVIVSETGVYGQKSATVTKKVPCKSSVTFGDVEAVVKNEGPCVITSVSNEGSLPSAPCTIQVYDRTEKTKVYGTLEVPALEPGASMDLTIPMSISVEDFNSVGVIQLNIDAMEGTEKIVSVYTKLVPGKPVVAEINGGAETIALSAGQSTTLTTRVGPWAGVAGDVHYSSSNNAVATVSQSGVVTARNSGTVTITAYYTCGVSTTITVTVSGSGSVEPSPIIPDPVLPDVPSTPSTPDTPEEPDVPAVKFDDVKEKDYFYDAVQWAVENGITTGTSASSFGPDESCTRAQAVTFLWRNAGKPKAAGTDMPFTDVNAGDYYYEAVLWAVENGITTGITADTFGPDEVCTRAQIVTFIYRDARRQGEGFQDAWMFRLPFTDVPEWAFEAVAWCYMKEITTGISETAFGPDEDCTRAQIVTFLYRSAQ